jgi:hypothetical protein
MSEDEGMEELVTEEMLWDRIPEVEGEERAFVPALTTN